MEKQTREQKALNVAKAFIAEDPIEYAGETPEQLAEQLLRDTSDAFIESAFEAYYRERHE